MSEPSIAAAIGIAVSSTRLRVVVLDEQRNAVDRFDHSIHSDSSIIDQIDGVFGKISVAEEMPVCIAVPGMVEIGTYQFVESRIAELSGTDLTSTLSVTNLVIENDANAVAYAEFVTGAGKGTNDLFCVSLDEGVGSGLILDGKIWRGANGFAGEFGAIVVDEEGSRLEDIASTANIVRRTRNRFHQDRTSTLRRFREEEITFEEILKAAEVGDDLALLMLERTGMFVGTALAAVINLLNVEKIVITGEVIRTPSAVLDAVVRRARQCSSSRAFNATSIELSRLDEFSAALGAALLALEARGRS
jgi:glucokinase